MPNIEKNKVIGKKIKAVPKPQPEIGIDITDMLTDDILEASETNDLDTSVLESFSTAAQTREQVYNLIDTMAQDDKVAAVLETYTEDTADTNDDGKIVWCESAEENIAKYVNYLLDSLNIDKHAYSWIYNLIKYGDLYLKLYRESDYMIDPLFSDKNQRDVLNEDIKISLHSNSDRYVPYVEAVANPGEMFELTKFGKTMGFIKAPPSIVNNMKAVDNYNYYLQYKMKKNDVTVYSATDFVHACLQTDTDRSPEEIKIFMNDDDYQNDTNAASYKVKKGKSILYNSFKVWRELTLLENSILLNRLTKSSIVRILNVEVKDMPKEQVANFLQRLKSNIEQKSALNVGKNFQEYTNPGPIDNIIYIPTHDGQGTITSQNLGGDVDVKSLVDVDYFLNQLYGALRAPKQFFNQTDDSTGFNGGTSLTIINSRYGKAIKRIQQTVCQLVTDLVNLFLVDRGLDSYVNKFTIKMQTPVTQEELDRRENMRNRLGVVQDIMGQINDVVTDDKLKLKITKQLLSTTISDPEVISLLQEQLDILEKEEEEGTKEENEIEENEEEFLSSSEEIPERENNFSPFDTFEGEETNIEEPEMTSETEEPLPSPNELNIDMTNTI